MEKLPQHGYLQIPLRLEGGRLVTCSLDESIRRYLQLNLNVPEQGTNRPAWMPADPDVGCRVPHYDFQAVADALGGDTGRLVTAIRKTAGAEPRIQDVTVRVTEIPKGDPVRRRRGGSAFKGVMKRVKIECRRVDGKSQAMHYDVALGGSGPVFEEEDV